MFTFGFPDITSTKLMKKLFSLLEILINFPQEVFWIKVVSLTFSEIFTVLYFCFFCPQTFLNNHINFKSFNDNVIIKNTSQDTSFFHKIGFPFLHIGVIKWVLELDLHVRLTQKTLQRKWQIKIFKRMVSSMFILSSNNSFLSE